VNDRTFDDRLRKAEIEGIMTIIYSI